MLKGKKKGGLATVFTSWGRDSRQKQTIIFGNSAIYLNKDAP